MKNSLFLFIIGLLITGCSQTPTKEMNPGNKSASAPDTTDQTNNFYDNTIATPLPVADLIVEGEIANPGKIDFSKLEVHSVIVKETLLDSAGGDSFTGAYRYDGYSLFDILNKVVLQKKNSSEFNPIIDLYVEIENTKGEKVVFSWGELYYPNNLHKIIVASSVSRIVPSKTKELWPLPAESKIVAGSDLITERNISSPVKITVSSVDKSFKVVKGMSPMYSPEFKIYDGAKVAGKVSDQKEKDIITFNTIFYGRGKGIHSTSPFSGLLVKDIIQKYYPVTKQNLQSGILCLTGMDGYRCAISYSEMFNRNDQQEFLLLRGNKDEDGGLYRVFAASDFFSDRAIKSLSGIYLTN